MSSYSSKFRHVYGEPAKKDGQYSDIKNALTSGESQYVVANARFFAYGRNTGGAPVYVRLLSEVGRTKPDQPKISTHKGRLLDMDFHPFIETIIATAGDDCKININQFSQDGVVKNITSPVMTLKGFKKKVALIKFNPAANNIIGSGSYDKTVRIFNVQTGDQIASLDHGDNIHSICWNRDGSMLASTSKDKVIRIFDPRKLDEAMCIEGAFDGGKSTKSFFINAFGWIGSTGFGKGAKRELKFWDLRNIEKPVFLLGIDNSASILMPQMDDDLNMLYLAGKGDNSVTYYEVRNDDKIAHYLGKYRGTVPQKGGGWVPKRGLNVMKCEVQRYLKLTQNSVIPISFIVPRKSGGEVFQEDIYPPCASSKPAQNADSWLQGNNVEPNTMSMDPDEQDQDETKQDDVFKSMADVLKENEQLKQRIKELEAEIAQLKGGGAQQQNTVDYGGGDEQQQQQQQQQADDQ